MGTVIDYSYRIYEIYQVLTMSLTLTSASSVI